MQCDACKQSYSINQPGTSILEYDGLSKFLCSFACLTDIAWQLREALPKLSKSRRKDPVDDAI